MQYRYRRILSTSCASLFLLGWGWAEQVEQMMRQRQLLPPAQHKGGAMSSALAPAPAAVLPFLRQLMTNAQHRTYVCSAAWALQDAHPGIVDLSQLVSAPAPCAGPVGAEFVSCGGREVFLLC